MSLSAPPIVVLNTTKVHCALCCLKQNRGHTIDQQCVANKRQYKICYDCFADSQRRTHRHNRRAKKRKLPGRLQSRAWAQILLDYKHKCSYCRTFDLNLQLDHIHSMSDGGSNTVDNIQPLCDDCHRCKDNRE